MSRTSLVDVIEIMPFTTKIKILLKSCVKKNITAPVNLFVNFQTKTRVAVI